MICLDTNVVLELLLERKYAQACRDYIAASQDDLALSLLSVSTVMYYAESKHLNLASVEQVLRNFAWLTVVEADATWAFERYAGKDFEDAIQVACALREGCAAFATLDEPLSRKYSNLIAVDLLR